MGDRPPHWLQSATMRTRHHEIDKGLLIIEATEAINDDPTDAFVEELESAITAGRHPRIIIDCRDVQFLSSFGLSMLMRVRTAARHANGEVKLAAVNSMILEMLRVTKMAQNFMVYPDVEQARIAFHPKSR